MEPGRSRHIGRTVWCGVNPTDPVSSGATAHDSRAFSREGATTDDGTSTEKSVPVATASALHASIETSRTTCELCGRQGHEFERCFKLTRAPVGDRQDILNRVGHVSVA